jgi:hypothetical protein
MEGRTRDRRDVPRRVEMAAKSERLKTLFENAQHRMQMAKTDKRDEAMEEIF